MRRRLWIVLLGTLVVALAGSVLAQMPLADIVAARDDAMNAGDVDAAVALYADDATYTVIFGPEDEPLVLTGIEAVRERLTGFVEDDVHYGATVMGVVGDTVRTFGTWTSGGLRSDGVDHIEQFEEFVVRDGKIVEHTMTVVGMVPLEAP
jgi:ketosteroid isomerase-like protein